MSVAKNCVQKNRCQRHGFHTHGVYMPSDSITSIAIQLFRDVKQVTCNRAL